MKQKVHYILILAALVTAALNRSFAQNTNPNSSRIDTTGTLIYPFEDEGEFQYPDEIDEGPLYLSNPKNIERKFEYDPETRQYIIYEKIGNMYYRLPKTMSLNEFVKYDFDRSIKDYWRSRKQTEEIEVQQKGLIPQLRIESEAFSSIFGSEIIDIKPQGYVEVQFGLETNYVGDNTLPERLQRRTNFDFENQINISVNGKIGDKVNLNFNYNTEATFDFENKMKMDYSGKEDEIIRKIEAGNVSLPLNGSLIQGGTNLFGIKTEMQFGKLNVTTILSQHKGESQVIETEGGAQKTKFNIKASDYDENRHFFISKYFREHYNEALRSLPLIRSNIKINKIEVWVTNKSQNFSSARDIVAFVDLGEVEQNMTNTIPAFGATGVPYPSNGSNKMYNELITSYAGIRNSSEVTKVLSTLVTSNFNNGKDWEKIDQARKLATSEYTFNEKLGFISLNAPLNNDEVLAVAYNYTVSGSEVEYIVGDFSTATYLEPGTTLILKLLKGVSLSPNLPTWDLMMKNVYNLGAYELSPDEFDFQVVYQDENNNFINYLPEGELRDTILLRLMNLDNMNSQMDAAPNGDGRFDFMEGITVIQQSGRIIFPVLEPFGANISENLSDPNLQKKYAFTTVYTDTKTKAEQDVNHDKFALIGTYKGTSGSEIMLNAFNLAPGSVKVTAGGRELEEDIDYVVDYAMGRVKIINDGLIEAGSPIQVSTESQEMISTQRKSMIGTYASYNVSEKLNIGGTMLWMNERPITNKVEMGEEPVTNMMLGLDFQYRDRSKLLTDIVNLLPFYESSVESSFSLEGEVAKLFPGKSKTTGNQIYIDDFEGVETPYSFINAYGWNLSSTPQGQSNMFSESDSINNPAYGYNRAKLAWYFIDRNVFNMRNSSEMPAHIKADLDGQSNHYTREISSSEIFPGRQLPLGSPNYLTVLNLAYYPREKGPYNYDTKPLSNISAGIDQNGLLLNPESRWGGIMRDIYTPNFEAANVEYIEFWLLDPFIYDDGTAKGGDLYFNLGNISEDILRDGRKAFENGLPATDIVENVDTTVWGRVSNKQQLGSGFENLNNSRQFQDLGFDGLNNDEEASFFDDYLSKLREVLSPDAFNSVAADPSSDDYQYFRGTRLDDEERTVLERYKHYNNPQGNSATTDMSNESYSTTGKTGPDMEDINKDNTLSETESYYQYKVSLRPDDMVVGKNFIVDKVVRVVSLANETKDSVNWYQFKIPVTDENSFSRIGNIYDFKSIRFMRMFMTNFEDPIILRFGTLNLIRADWRKETSLMLESGGNESSNAMFELTSINIEENNTRRPINYILPPNIEREIDPSNPTQILMNEQSMLLKVHQLEKGDAKAVFKDLGIDMRQFKRLRMEVHAEAIKDEPLNDYELSLIIRLGSDLDNYYEYEIPLKLTPVPGTLYNNEVVADRYIVWPDENRLDIALEKFSELKLRRDAEIRKAGSTLSRNQVYDEIDPDSPSKKNILRIKGNPSIGEVQRMHVGIRNPVRNNLSARSVEVWLNELRLSDFDVKGGWASNARMALRLADLGSVSVAGRTQSVGWGSINQAASQRSLDNRYQFDIAATTELGKLLPEAIGLHMPLFYSISKSVANPEYNPLSSDIKMSDAIAMIDNPEERDSLLASAQDVTVRESFNLNNITLTPKRKKADRKPWPTDIENFSVSYAKNEQLSHNIDVEKDLRRLEKGVFNYNYSMRSEPITPLKNVKFLKAKPLQIISDFNFSLLPEMISFRTDLTRNYNERLARNNSGMNFDIPTTVQKDLLWNRYFDFRYNLTRSLSIDFTNKNVSRIDELEELTDKDLYQLMMEEIFRDSSYRRPVDYQHSVKINYRVPINKLPLLDWTSATLNYDGDYGWMAGPVLSTPAGENPIEVGNTATNGMNIRANGQLNFITLYNKVPYLKRINNKYQSNQRAYGSKARANQGATQQQTKETGEPKKTKEVKYTEKNVAFRADVPKSIFHRLETNKVTVVVLNEKGDTVQGEVTVVDNNRINFKPATSIRSGKVLITGTKEITETIAEKAIGYSVRALLGVRAIRVTYSLTGGTELPGFLPEPYLFGANNYVSPTDASNQSLLAPTLPFLLGWQDENFVLEAAKNGWITVDNSIQKQYMLNQSENWNFGLTFEPIPNVTIEFTGSWREAQNYSSSINYNSDDLAFELLNGKETGNFDMTILTLRTAFRDKLSDDSLKKTSSVFEDFRNVNRYVIANRLNAERGWNGENGYSKNPAIKEQGISLNSSDVVIPAFLAAYTGIDPNKIPLTARPGLEWIRPNWRINYRGNPQRIEWMKDYIHSLNFTHSYKSNYSVGRFETNLAYSPDENGLSWVRDEMNGVNFVPELDITSINIQEALNPLINVDVGFKNDLSTRFEINRSRNLNFDFANMQLNETIKNEYSAGIGYRFTGMDMIIRSRAKTETVSNDVNLRFDLTSSNYKNTLRKIDVRDGEINGGSKVFSMDFQADYMVSDKLTVKLYYQYNLNKPHTTNAGFTRTNTKFGLSFNFSIL